MAINRLAIIQARMSSSRLPGKVMADIGGKPLLLRMLERVQQAQLLDRILVATTTDPSDDVLEQFCQNQHLPCFRGSLPDVLDRFYQAALQSHPEVIVRLTADCPLIDPGLIDLALSTFLGNLQLTGVKASSRLPNPQVTNTQGTPLQVPDPRVPDPKGSIPLVPNPNAPLPLPPDPWVPDPRSPITFSFDFLANRLPPPWKRSLPIGLDVEVCTSAALERAWKEAHEQYQREHVLPYLYEGATFPEPDLPPQAGWYLQSGSTPRGFHVGLLDHTPDYGSLRWTVDTPSDLEFVRQVYARFEGLPYFSWQDILALLEREPELAQINAGVKHRSAFDVDPRSLKG